MIVLLLASCYYTCPGDRAPIDLGVDWSVQYHIPPVYVGRLIGMIEGSTGDSWVCSIECDVPWAGAWVGSEAVPFTPIELPTSLRSDALAYVGFWLDGSAVVGETASCDLQVSGPETWNLTVEVLP